MKHKHRWMLAAALLSVAALGLWRLPVQADGAYVAQIPDFKLQDPSGAEHTDEQIAGQNGTVIIVTIPNVKHGETQGRWSRWLTKDGWPENGPHFVMIEDLEQSAVREKALESMKEKFKPGQKPLLLLDHAGEVRRAFRVPQDETVVMIFNKDGALVKFYNDKPTLEDAKDARKLIQSMAK
ncbi:MAG: hypothetical protein M5U26_25125 [Planctomycetota bacterium]|nr:hypothetical protein [Planctomycetota bacterium]